MYGFPEIHFETVEEFVAKGNTISKYPLIRGLGHRLRERHYGLKKLPGFNWTKRRLYYELWFYKLGLEKEGDR